MHNAVRRLGAGRKRAGTRVNAAHFVEVLGAVNWRLIGDRIEQSIIETEVELSFPGTCRLCIFSIVLESPAGLLPWLHTSRHTATLSPTDPL